MRAGNPVVAAKTLAILIERLQKHPSEWVRSSCADSLSNLGAKMVSEPTVLSALIDRLQKDPSERVRCSCADSLRDLGAKVVSEPTVLTALIDRLQKDKSGKVQISCAQALQILGEQATEPVVTALVERLEQDYNTKVLETCAFAIRNLGERAVAKRVFAALEQGLQKSKFLIDKEDPHNLSNISLGISCSGILYELRALEKSLRYKKPCEPLKTPLASEDSSVTAASPSSSSSSASSPTNPKLDVKSPSTIMQDDLPAAIKKQSEELFAAIRRRNAEEVERLIALGVPLNIEDSENYTPLSYAAAWGNLAIVKCLLATPERRATAMQAPEFGDTALMLAAAGKGNLTGNLSTVTHLIEQKANPMEKNKHGCTALMRAVSAPFNFSMIQYLIEQKADCNEKDEDGKTALMCAARIADIDDLPLVQYLVEKKADCNERDQNGETALMHAAGGGHLSTVKHLIEQKASFAKKDYDSIDHAIHRYGLDTAKQAEVLAFLKALLRQTEQQSSNPLFSARRVIDLATPKLDVKSQTLIMQEDLPAAVKQQSQALFLAIDENDVTKVENLIRLGAPLNVENSGGFTPLSYAAALGDLAIVKRLLATPARHAAARLATKFNGTALMAAARFDHLTIVQYLIEKNASFTEKDNLGQTALMVAVNHKSFSIVKHLIQQNASLAEKNSHGDTPLIVAARNGDLPIAQYLLNNNASLAEKNNCGDTALMCAASNGNLPIVQELIKQKASLNEKNEDGDTALMMAADHSSIVQYLVEQKASIGMKNKKGHSVFDFIRNQDGELVAFLKDSQAKFEQQSSGVLHDSSSSSQPSSTSSVSASPSTSSLSQFVSSSSSQTSIQPQLSVTPKEAKILSTSPAEIKDQEFTENWEVVWPGDLEDSFDSAASQSSSSSSSSSVTPKPDVKDRKLDAGIIPTPPSVPLSSVAAIPSLQPKTAPIIATNPSDQKQRVSQISGQTEVVEIQAEIRQGNVDVLLIQLQTGSQTAAVSPAVAKYIKHDALSDALRAKVNPTAEIKGEQQKKLDQLLDALLVDPSVSVTRENTDGLTPIDIALQHQDQLPAELITKLQHRELEENDRQYSELMHFVKEHKFDKPEDQKKQTEMLGLLGELDQTLQALDHAVKSPVTAAPAATEASSSLSSVDYTPEQLAQIDRARERLKVRLTEAYTKSLAVHYNLLNTHSQDRVGKAVSIVSSTLFYFFPIPGLPLAGKLLYEAGKFITSSAVGTGAKKLDRKRQTRRHDNRIDNMATMDQVAQRMMALVGALTQRFQDIFAHLDPESVDVFVDTIVSRLMKRWGEIGEKFEKEGIDRNILAECLIDFDFPLPKNSPHSGLSPEDQFDNLIQNMVMSTLRKVRKTDASGYTARITAGSGMKADAASFILGDRMVKLSGKKVMVQEVCRDTPPLTWLGDTNEHGQPIYYRCKLTDSVDDHKQDLSLQATTPIIFLTEEECVLRGFEAVAPVDQQLPFPPMRSVPDPQLQRIKELEKLLAESERRTEAEKARADAEKTRADTLAARLTKLEQSKTALSPSSPVSAANGFTTPGIDFFALPRLAPLAVTPPIPVVEEPVAGVSSSASSALLSK